MPTAPPLCDAYGKPALLAQVESRPVSHRFVPWTSPVREHLPQPSSGAREQVPHLYPEQDSDGHRDLELVELGPTMQAGCDGDAGQMATWTYVKSPS